MKKTNNITENIKTKLNNGFTKIFVDENNEVIHIKNTDRLLKGLAALDIALASTGYLFPKIWFKAFHGVDYIDPQGLLQRSAGNWAMFAILQAIALKNWEEEPGWLAVIAGVRLSDILTDWSYLWSSSDLTILGRLSLFGAGPANLLSGIYFYKAYKKHSS